MSLSPLIARRRAALQELNDLLPDAFRFYFSQAPVAEDAPRLPSPGMGGLLGVTGIVGDLSACLCLAMEPVTAVRLFSAPLGSQILTQEATELMEGLTRYALARLAQNNCIATFQGCEILRVKDFHRLFSLNAPALVNQYHCQFGRLWQMILPPTM
jgi:hypothetical protein